MRAARGAGDLMRPARLFAVAGLASLGLAPFAADAGEEPARPVAVGVRLVKDDGGAQLTFDLSRPVEARAFTMASPDRIVVDLPEVVFQIDSNAGRSEELSGTPVRSFRFGRLAPGRSRVVVALSARACPVHVGSKPIAPDALASRLTIDIKPCDAAAFEAAALP